MKSPIIGIDLGTTNSLVACVRDGKPEILTSREGERLVPSVVTFTAAGPVVGYAAKRAKVRQVAGTVFSVKRLLGRAFDDLREQASDLPYALEAGEGIVRVRLGDRSYTPIEISALILRELRSAAEIALGQPVRQAVITVPAYFNDSQRQATRAAGRLAGLEVLRIINEPTAASLAYGLDRKRQGLIAVYDLGGGTFDVSILKLRDGVFEVLATNGNTSLGGDDLDQVIAQVAIADLARRGVDVRQDRELHAQVLEQAERVKIALSTQAAARFEIPQYSREWTAEEFESRAQPLLEKTRGPCLQALRDAGIRADELSDVVLVGGPTRLRLVRETARAIFGREPDTSVHPDEVVALGAAIQADILAGNNPDLLLLDVVPLSLGIETYGGLMSALIPRNTRIPTAAREVFTTFVDNQTGVDVHVLQGERERVEENRSLARFKLGGIEPLPAGIPRVEVLFLIDADGILQVAAKDLRTGKEQAIEVRPSFGLGEGEVERMLDESARNAESDVAYRRLVEVKNEARAVLTATEKKLPDARRLLTPAEASGIENQVAALRGLLAGVDPRPIQDATFALSQSTIRLAELIIKEVIATATPKRQV